MAQLPNNGMKWKALWGRAWVRWILGYVLVLACGVGLVYYWRVAYGFSALGPGAATAVVCVAFSAVYWAVFLCAHFVRQKLWLKAACLVVLGGLCFGAANPPLQAPDETGHYLRAYALGSGHFTFRQDEDFPADVDALCEAFPGFYNRELIEPGLATMAEGFTRYENLKASGAAAPASTLVQQFFGYIPQAAGVAAGRLFGADALWCMYLARLANLLCYAALCGMAVYLAGRFLPILLALMLCPISLFMAASCSSDGIFLGATWLFVGACLSPAVTKKRTAALLAGFAAMFAIKPTAVALLPLIWLRPAPPRLLGRKGRRTDHKPLAPWVGHAATAAACLAVAVALFAALSAYSEWAKDYTPVYEDSAIRPVPQLLFILQNIPRYLAVWCYSMYRDKWNLFAMGGFGWMDMTVSFVSYFSPLVLLFSAALSALEGAREKLRTAWVMGLTALLMYGATYTGLYLTSTPYQLPEINGVQTRYLLAAFFALLVLAAMLLGRTMALQDLRPGKPQKTPPAWRMMHLSFVFAVVCAVFLFQNYYIGIEG